MDITLLLWASNKSEKSEINDNQQTRTADKQAQKKKQWTSQLLVKKMYWIVKYCGVSGWS